MIVFLKAKWEDIIMANYEIDPELLLPFLPKGVTLDLYEGKAYVSLVGFMFMKTKLFNISIPCFGSFEEINLRFYVKRIESDGQIKRGVVFINETIPYPIVAWMANKLYKEHYTVVPTKNRIKKDEYNKMIQFEWKLGAKWNSIQVKCETQSNLMVANSFEQFIFDHYYGYTKIDEQKTEEYQLKHPIWMTHKVMSYSIDCDFKTMYGNSFSILNNTRPSEVFIAKGSDVAIFWKRKKFTQ
jgi:uncharacterized protein YqjF (DUF2071 family)